MPKEITVDAKPAPKLPYDPEVIPPAVRKRAAAVDALYSSTAPAPPKVELKSNGSDGSVAVTTPAPSSEKSEPAPTAPLKEPALTPQVPVQPVPPAAAAPAPAPAEPSHAPPPPDDDNSPTWRGRAVHEKGRREGMERQIAALQDQMVQMGNELLHAQRMLNERSVAPPSPPPAPPPPLLTEQDEQQYGRDLIDFTQRAATQAVAPHIQRLNEENADLRRQVARDARRTLDQAVAAAVPNFQEIDRDPRWHRWLMGIDLFSGRVRQHLLNEAIAAASAPRVISFFQGFLNEGVATGHIEPAPSLAASAPREPAIPLASLAAPGRARPAGGGDTSMPPEKPIYTRAQLRELYAAHRKGAYVGREAEWASIDADIIAAGREGRVLG